MRQFIQASDLDFTALAQRCRNGCSVFRDQEMPPGSRPSRARIGFEGNDDGTVTLLVDRGISYAGPSTEAREWLGAGKRQFPSMDATKQWIRTTLGACYDASTHSPDAPNPGHNHAVQPPPDLRKVTDMDEVTRRIHEAEAAHVDVDPDALFDVLTKRVRGQPDALRILSHGVFRHLAQTQPRRPATFFCVGPTGVGKTTAAETLSLALDECAPVVGTYRYLRLDMSEYQERHRVSQLVGAPQGYVGYGDGAQLLDHLDKNPRCIVLFDEIEKAHPDVLTFLMNAMDAGRISRAHSGGRGHEIDCRRAIFLFTSNLDSAGILKDLQESGPDTPSATVNAVCRRHLRDAGIRPEILGRIGAYLAFSPLSTETRAEIIALSIGRVAAQYGVVVGRIDPDVIVAVYSQLEDDDFGARPAEQLVDELLGHLFAAEARRTALYPDQPVAIGGPPFSLSRVA